MRRDADPTGDDAPTPRATQDAAVRQSVAGENFNGRALTNVGFFRRMPTGGGTIYFKPTRTKD